MSFTLTHPDPAHDHVHCDRCGQSTTVPQGDARGIRAWQTSHECRPYRGQAAA